jgi:hypothetical protein
MTVEDELQASFVALDISKNNFKSLDSSTTAAISYEQLKQINIVNTV